MWKVIDNYHMKNGNWTITKSMIKDVAKYSLYQDNNRIDGVFSSADEAKAKYEELNNGR